MYWVLKKKEVVHLRKTFDPIATEENGTKRLTQSTFLSFFEASSFLPPSLRDAGALVYRIPLCLSQYPFYSSIPEALTCEELMRALAWTMPSSGSMYEEDQYSRDRSPADPRRQLFQSFATTRDGKSVPFDAEHAKKQAERRALFFTGPSRRDSRHFAATNYDDDGDEMFHEILDVLYSVQPLEIGWQSPPRNSFRPVARKLAGDERLHNLSISQDEFRAVLKLLVTTCFGKQRVSVEQLANLDHVVDCMVRPVVQRPDIGIIWVMYEQAVGNGTPVLMEGLTRFLGPFYKDNPEADEDITIDLPPPGKTATFPVLAQMSFLEIFSWFFVSVKPPKFYDLSITTVTASALADDLESLPKVSIALLLSGKNSQTGEKSAFGYYVLDVEFELPSFLFQLSQIQDAFRGNTIGPGHELDRGKLRFGQKGNGFHLVLQQDLKRAIVSHSASGQHTPMYAATA